MELRYFIIFNNSTFNGCLHGIIQDWTRVDLRTKANVINNKCCGCLFYEASQLNNEQLCKLISNSIYTTC